MQLREIMTWNPLNTPEVKEIVKHATRAELLQMQLIGLFAGLTFFFTMALFSQRIAQYVSSGDALLAILFVSVAIFAVVAEVVGVRYLSRRQLCNTAWAKEHGLNCASLKLTLWP